MKRRTYILITGPLTIEDRGVTAKGRCYHLVAPHGIGTLNIYCEPFSSIPERELRHVGGCWFRDAWAADIRAGGVTMARFRDQ